jgi:hypothetical protein
VLDDLRTGTAGLEHALVQLTLTGAVDLATRAALETHLERWSGELCHLEVRDQLLAGPSESDLLDLAGSPVVGTVARELADLAAADPAQREAAKLALRLLFIEHHRLGSHA